ncbi:MAG: putative histidine kinase, CheA, partial [Ramlibacter sp.]|nr:putative histidine kinase, CheA [Ramlibacter sp.]
MQAAAQDHELANNDLGPLAWVLDELRKSLESASSALRRFVRDTAQAKGEDMASVDTGHLRIARQHMHQAVGALEMVGLVAPAHMLRSMEGAAQKFIERPELCTEAAAGKVERAGFALTEYLEALLGGKAVSPLSLFLQYKDVQDLCGADRVHPADLWGIDWRWNDFPGPATVQPLNYDPAIRARMDQAVLRVVKTADAAAGRDLVEVSLGLAATQTARQPKIFWKIAAGYFDAIALGLLPADLFVKRAASRVLLQYASLAKGDTGVSDRLAQDLVFFCAQAMPAKPADGPALSAVRQGYGLAANKPVDYASSPFGRFDPVLLAQLRKRIGSAKETWSALSGGDTHKIKSVVDQFTAVCDTLVKLYPASATLAQSLLSAIESVSRSARAPSAELAMEVATAVLYLEAAFQDLDPNDAELAERTARLAERLKKVVQGGQPEPLEHWVEDLYRRVSDRQTMGSVVGELRGTLGELEKLLDQFFRNTAEKGPLREAPNFLAQMRGVLSVLGLDQAAHAVMRMRDSVENIIVTEIDEEKARAAGTFEKLGTNLGALGFLIDMLNYQPSLAKKLFVWDDAQGELRPLMGRAPDAHVPAEAQHVEAPLDFTPVAVPAVPAASVAPVQAVAAPAPAPAATAAAPQAASSAAVKAEEDDDGEEELREIFLEEAREVVGNGLAALEALAAEPGNLADMTTLRRAFHTLKGSSRMVGLNEFGEAAWSLEQVLNTWLADQKQATDDLRALSTQALKGFGRWIEDIAARSDSAWRPAAFRVAADAMRTESRLLAIEMPAAESTVASSAPTLVPELPADTPPQDAEIVSALVALQDVEPAATPAPQAAPAADAPVFDLTFDLGTAVTEPAALAAAPAEPVAELPAFELDFPTDEAVDRAPATQPAELSADDLPPEFALELGTPPAAFTNAYTATAPGDLEELPELATTAILPKAELPKPPIETALEIEGIDFSSLSAVTGPVTPAAGDAAAMDLSFEWPPAAEAAEPAKPQLRAVPPAARPEPDADLDAALPARDEQVKVIGSLRIGIPLYNVYLNEADEWSRRLATEISEWALEMNQRVPDSTVGWAHSLAGSSATVGFHALSEIARALEGALQHTQSLACGTADHARTFIEASEEVRRLLHQFAAGFLKEPEPRILQALQELKDAEGEPRTETPPMDRHSGFGGLIDMPAPPPMVASGPVAKPAALTVAASKAPLVKVQEEEEIDVVDAIDPDLFPIFEEEGAELMPQLGTALRAWAAHPDHREPRDIVLRALHTLKGSARLAGALQLGELAHRLESEVEYLGHENIASADIEALLHRFDAMQARFDTLRATGGFAPSDPSVAATPQPEP